MLSLRAFNNKAAFQIFVDGSFIGKVGFTRRQLQLLDLEPGSFVFVATPCHKVTTASQVKISPLLEAKDFVSFLSTSHFEEYLSMNLGMKCNMFVWNRCVDDV